MRHLIFSLIVICFVGCGATVRHSQFDSVTRPPSVNVDIYTGIESIGKPYKEIALITVEDNGNDLSETELLDKAKERAATLGADAIILLSSENRDEAIVPIGKAYFNVQERIIRASAIVYTP